MRKYSATSLVVISSCGIIGLPSLRPACDCALLVVMAALSRHRLQYYNTVGQSSKPRCGKVDTRLSVVSLTSRGGDRWRPSCAGGAMATPRSEEHTSELQSPTNLVCR